jgi:hypothetical protein
MEQDSPWKEIVEELFEAFLAFFFPRIHEDIDWSRGYQFLDQELRKILKGSATSKRVVDKLVKVFLKDGAEKWLLIHIEIQSYPEKKFPERMFVYNYRIFDKAHKEVVSLALLTDENPRFRPSEYRRERWGFEVLCRFPIVKVIDYRERWAELEASDNPFAVGVSAYLRTMETKGNVQERYSWKKHFLLELYRRRMSRETLLALYKFIDWIMEVPEELENEISEEIRTIEEKTPMPHMTSMERLGLKQGLAEGIAAVLEIKFGQEGLPLCERVSRSQKLDTLQKLMERLKYAQSLQEAERVFDELAVPKQGMNASVIVQ